LGVRNSLRGVCTTISPAECSSRQASEDIVEKVEELLAKAARFREMARMIGDPRTHAALIELAGEYEAQAQVLVDRHQHTLPTYRLDNI
jgi:hypothetical protein